MTTSYRTLNQIFYNNNNKFDDPHSIHLLEDFFYKGLDKMAIESTLSTLSNNDSVGNPQPIADIEVISCIETIQNIDKIEQKQEIEQPIPQKKSNRFAPFLTDTIFWCIFHHVYGEMEYTMIKSKHGNRMLEEKQKIMEHFQKTPKSLKQTNVKMTNDRIKETMSEFMCAKNCSSFLETAAYALYYNLTIYIIDEQNRTYLHFCKKTEEVEEEPTDVLSSKLCILYVSRNTRLKTERVGIYQKKQYHLLKDISEFNLSLLDSFVCLEQFDKPLKALTHYKKIAELEEIANKLGIQLGSEKMKKPELYNLLAQKMAWS
jgi:hypothetical protein